mgnify:FL=1
MKGAITDGHEPISGSNATEPSNLKAQAVNLTPRATIGQQDKMLEDFYARCALAPAPFLPTLSRPFTLQKSYNN